MLLHIVMVAVNNADMTRKAIESITTRYEYELHLIDQASSENFGHIEGDYKRFDPMVSLSEAWNYGIRKSLEDKECKYIFIPNNDVFFHHETIDTLIRGIDLLGYLMVTGENVQPKMSLEDMMNDSKPGDWNEDSKPITSWMEQGPDFSCFMITPETIEKIGFFDENFAPAYCEDQCYHMRIIRSGNIAKRLTTAPYYHYASQTMAKNMHLVGMISEGHNRNKGYYREKWGADHADCLEGRGFMTPYGEENRSVRYWRGVEKYYDFEVKRFGRVIST